MTVMNNKLYTINRKQWESDFFGIEIFELSLENFNIKDHKNDILAYIKNYPNKVDIIEVNLPIQNFNSVSALEEIGFRMMDSKIQFLTKIDRSDSIFTKETKSDVIIRNAEHKDLDQISNLVKKYLTDNSEFISRYKNLDFFPENSANKYYNQWVNFCFENKNTYITVCENKKGEIVAFFIFLKESSGDEVIYKGVLTVIEKEFRGLNLHLVMQSFLYNQFNEDTFLINNTTQLSNFPVIANHIKSSRKLNLITLNMMLRISVN